MTPEKKGMLVRAIGGFYTVRSSEGEEFVLRCRKKFRREHLSPLVGDCVLFNPGRGEEHGWLEEVLPRRSVCLRPPVANVSCLVIVVSPVPEPDLILMERQIARARGQEMETVIVVTKRDLDASLPERLKAEFAGSDVPVYSVSAKTGEGMEELKERLLRKGPEGESPLCCLSGQSGAGKSTLLNALLGLQLETGEISRRIARGKNTTRQVELIEKDGLRIMDTAGFSLMEPEKDLQPEALKERYPEFLPYEGKCRFRECLHDREPGCAVAEAADKGLLPAARLERYRELLHETREVWRERYD